MILCNVSVNLVKSESSKDEGRDGTWTEEKSVEYEEEDQSCLILID